VNTNSELNALTRAAPATTATEMVRVTTLDERLQACGWKSIEFVKMDAEGEESNILRGGERFFAELSPLVQYEIRAGEVTNLALVEEFAALGYRSYRLVPGLGILIPLATDAALDPFLLNLFCCKDDRAQQLAKRGLLAHRAAPELKVALSEELDRSTGSEPARVWREREAGKPYFAEFAAHWSGAARTAGRELVDVALACHAISQDLAAAPQLRVLALSKSVEALGTCVRERPSHPRLLSLARVSQEYGERQAAVRTFGRLIDEILRNRQVDLSEPFLAPNARLEAVNPGVRWSDWLIAGILEQVELLGSLSSYFTAEEPARSRLSAISRTGFGSAEMSRRLALLNARFGNSRPQ
jgi:hypothetical protein